MRRTPRTPWFSTLLLATFLISVARGEDIKRIKRERFGWTEPVLAMPGAFELHGKLDTGADRTSIHAEDIKIEEDFVSFTSVNHRGEARKFRLPLAEYSKIKRHHRKSEKRPVVEMTFCIGTHLINAEVTLTDRSNYSLPLLVGRDILQFFALIDSSARNITQPDCKEEK